MIEISILLLLFSRGTGVFSLEKTVFLKSVLPFLILACHYCPVIIPIENNIRFLGYYAVSIFFFISGYGLSLKQDSSAGLSVRYFLHKIWVLTIPLLTTSILYISISYFLTGAISINLVASLKRGEFVHPISWFVLKLILLYIFMYASSKFGHKTIILVTLILLSMGFEKLNGIPSTYYTSDLAFFAGCIYKKIGVYSWSIWVRKISYMLIVIIMLIFPTKIMPFICFCLPIFVVSLFCTINVRQTTVSKYLGSISYELYLVQISAALLVNHYFVAHSLFQQLLAFALICLLSVLIASLMKPVDTLLCNKLNYVRFIK